MGLSQHTQRTGFIPDQVDQTLFDLVVIGAGINGTGVARDAAMRNLRVLLLDKADIASGTSSRSGRMIHGGLRYLEHGDLGLVMESLRERAILMRIAPHLVRTHALMIPFYRQNEHKPWQVRLGLTALDLLSVLSRSWIGTHRTLSHDAVRQRIADLNPDGLTGACMMPDAYAQHGERLCVENSLSAVAAGATIVTYAQVTDLLVEDGKIRHVVFDDRIGKRQYKVRARVVVNMAGPWVDRVLGEISSDAPLVGGTKGSFLVVDPFPGAPDDPCFYEAFSDHRQVVVLPWNGCYLIGTTDQRYEQDPDDAVATRAEVDYLLAETNRAFLRAELSEADVRFSYAGVRPLPYQPEGAEGSITRKHIIHDHAPDVAGLLSVIGGKFSTFRSLSRQVVDAVCKKLGRPVGACSTHRVSLPGGKTDNFAEFCNRFRTDASLPSKSADRLLTVYGTRAPEVLALCEQNGDALVEPFDSHTGAIGAEILFAFRNEFAQTLSDALIGRTMVGYDSAFDPRSAVNAARIAQQHLGWDDHRAADELEAYHQYIERFNPRSSRQTMAVAEHRCPNEEQRI